eukprot:2841682-Prorocentrum_lima.AAC.1
MTSSLVGSEMCIRDRILATALVPHTTTSRIDPPLPKVAGSLITSTLSLSCLLYTSDAADDM